jgi:hypothetical protein
MSTRDVVEGYFQAWSHGNLEAARGFLADQLDFQGSIDTFQRADDFVATLRGFVTILRGVTVLQSYFTDDGAAMLYDCDTKTPAGVIRTAEFFKVSGGKIIEIRLVFDATVLRPMMAAAAAGGAP